MLYIAVAVVINTTTATVAYAYKVTVCVLKYAAMAAEFRCRSTGKTMVIYRKFEYVNLE